MEPEMESTVRYTFDQCQSVASLLACPAVMPGRRFERLACFCTAAEPSLFLNEYMYLLLKGFSGWVSRGMLFRPACSRTSFCVKRNGLRSITAADLPTRDNSY